VPARPRPADPERIRELIAMGVSEYLSVSARHRNSLRRLD
jgi:hypothetical protein